MTIDQDRISLILKVVVTIISAGIILFWILVIDLGAAVMGGPFNYIAALAALLIFLIIGIAATIAIWKKPLFGGIGFIILGVFTSFIIYMEPATPFPIKQILVAFSYIVCAGLALAVWWKTRGIKETEESVAV